MKKTVSLIIAMIMVMIMTLTACGVSTSPSNVQALISNPPALDMSSSNEKSPEAQPVLTTVPVTESTPSVTSSTVSHNESGNTSGNLENRGKAAQYGDMIYFSRHRRGENMESIFSTHSIYTDGTNEQKLDDIMAMHINIVGDRIYYADYWNDAGIYSMKPDGSDKRKLRDGMVYSLHVTGERIFYCMFSEGLPFGIRSMNPDGSDERLLLEEENVWSLYVFDGRIYFNVLSQIFSMTTDGNDLKRVCNDDLLKSNIIVHDDRIFWLGTTGEPPYIPSVYSMKLDGSNRVKHVDLDESRYCYTSPFNISHGRILYSHSPSGMLYSVNMDGGDLRQMKVAEEWSSSIEAISVVGEWIMIHVYDRDILNYFEALVPIGLMS